MIFISFIRKYRRVQSDYSHSFVVRVLRTKLAIVWLLDE
jgi:hypothetical protein